MGTAGTFVESPCRPQHTSGFLRRTIDPVVRCARISHEPRLPRTRSLSLRPLLDLARDHERFRALAGLAREARGVPVHMSASIQPYLLAALVEAPDGLGGRPALVVAADDIGARDLARELRAYLAPRRVRYYPSRGTGYSSHLAPPPHLVGLRIAALDALGESEPAVVVASAIALAEAVPDASLRPAGFTLGRGERVDLTDVGARLVEAGYERVDQV